MDNSEMDELRGVPEHMNSENAGGQGPSTMSTGAATTAAADIVKLPEDIGMAAATAPLQTGPTVVVKVASQSVPDIVVEYQEGWTIKDLKQHLCDQHTLHPSVKEQRLIYSGHLLSDESHLASALRHSTATDSRPVLHLVCAPPRPGRAPPQQMQQPSVAEVSQQQPVVAGAGGAARRQQEATPASTDGAASSSISDGAGTSSAANANLNTATDGVRHRPHAAAGQGAPTMTVPGAVNPAAALQQYYAQYYSYLNYMQLTGATGAYGTASPAALAAWLEQHQQALSMQQLVTVAQGTAVGLGPQEAAPGPAAQAADGPPPPQQRNEVAEAPQLNGPLDNIGGAVAEEDAAGAGHDWLDSLYIITRFGVLSFFIYFYSTVYRFALIITVTVLIYLYHAGWFRPPWTPQEQQPQADPPQQQQPAAQEQNQPEQQPPPAPQPQETDNNNQVRQPPVFIPPNNMDDRNNNIANNNNNNDVDEMLVREQPYHEQVPVAAVEPAAATTTEAIAPPPPSLLMLSWTFFTTFFTSLIPEQPHLL